MRMICFCGMDGAGKSTQCKILKKRLEDCGYRVNTAHILSKGSTLSSKYQDKGFLKNILEKIKKLSFEGWQGGVKLYVGLVSFYFDAWLTYFYYLIKFKGHFVVFDRYFYDHLANFIIKFPKVHRWIYAFCLLLPRPHVIFIIEVQPVLGHARKEEESIAVLEKRFAFYRSLAGRLGLGIIDGADSIDHIADSVLERVLT